MMKSFLVEVAQNPKVGMAMGGALTSAGAAIEWFNLAKEWAGAVSIIIGVALSLAALVAQIVRIRNDRRADRRAEEMHRAQLEAMKNARGN